MRRSRMNTVFINTRGVPPPSTYYRTAQGYVQQHAQPRTAQIPARPAITDDYERWYTDRSYIFHPNSEGWFSELVPGNRMTLSVRSGIHSEISWALNRLCHLSLNENFHFVAMPGLIDSLFDWPEWYIKEGHKLFADKDVIFSTSPQIARQQRFALESLFVIRNAVPVEENSKELATHSRTLSFIMNTLHNLNPSRDENTEFLQHTLDIFNIVATTYYAVPHHNLVMNPFPPLFHIVSASSNRTMIIVAMNALTSLFSNPVNGVHLKSDSPALTTSIRFLPLFNDKPLIDTCVNYLYAHITHPSMARAFLFHPDMPRVLKVLANLLIHEQLGLEKTYTLDITGTVHTVPSDSQLTRDHELTQEELDSLVSKPEPQRCYDWMKTMFIANPEGEVTQVDFWNMYKDAFAPFSDQYQLLVASDVIKNVNNIFPQAQAMVVAGPIQRFVVRGVDRRRDVLANDRYRCLWDRSQCEAQPFASLGELYDHVLQHLSSADSPEIPCLWSTCPRPTQSKLALTSHVLTHVSSTQPTTKHPTQSDTITLPTASHPFPTSDPTSRPPPPPRNTTISYEIPVLDPPSISLTALLIIRILFRTSFASADAAPRVDADHFGFPGVVEETEDPENADLADCGAEGDEKEGERRGRKAFVSIRKSLEGVRIRDEALMSWVTEMVDEGVTESAT